MGSDTISRKSLVLAGMGPLFGAGGRADASGKLVHLHSAASDITEQLSKETGGLTRNSRWSWVQGMWAFHFQVEVLQFTGSTYNSGGKKTRECSHAASSTPEDSTQESPLSSL